MAKASNYYNSCVDIDILPDTPASHADPTLKHQDPMLTAVPNSISRNALTTGSLQLSSQQAKSSPTSVALRAAYCSIQITTFIVSTAVGLGIGMWCM